MPPKKRVRGPKLPVLREERAPATSDDSLNESSDLVEVDDFRNERNGENDTISDENPHSRVGNSAVASLTRYVKKLVVDAFRTSFQSVAEDAQQILGSSSQKLVAAFKKAVIQSPLEEGYTIFFNEMDIRLIMIIEDVTVIEQRARVFKTVALAAVNLIQQGHNEMLTFLLNFAKEWGMSDNVSARTNSTTLLCYILDTGSQVLKPDKDGVGSQVLEPNEDGYCGFSIEHSEAMFLQIKRSLYDRESGARVSGIRGMANLQKHPMPSSWGEEARSASPRELLMRSFRDVAWECRLVAMQSLNPREQDVMVLADIISYDKCLNVRVAGLQKFGELRPNRSVRHKIAVLDVSLRDHEKSVREQGREVLKAWVERLSIKWSQAQKPKETDDIIETNQNTQQTKGYILSAQAIVLLWLSDYPETVEAHENLRQLVVHLFDVVRKLYMCQNDPANVFSEAIMTDLKGATKIENAIPIIVKGTIGSILEDTDVSERYDAYTFRAMVFFWRCLIDYLSEKKKNESDKFHALQPRFLAPLKTMVDHLAKTLEKVKELEYKPNYHDVDNFVEATYIAQMSIIENFLSVMRHTQSDQSGLDAYKAILVSMLMNMCYQKKIIDLVIIELSQFYKDCPHDLMSLVYAKTNEMRQKFKYDKFPQLENTLLVGESMVRAKYDEESGNKGKKIIDFYELMVVNSILKTGMLSDWDEEYQNRYGEMLKRGINSTDVDTRILSAECLGMIGVFNQDLVEDELLELIEKFDEEHESVKCTILVVLTDLYIQYGNDFSKSIRDSFGFEKNNQARGVPSLFVNALVDRSKHHQEAALRAAQGLVKMLLNMKIEPELLMWQKAMQALMFKASFTIKDRLSAQIRSTILVALKFFCAINKSNQLLLIKSFRPFFHAWCNSSHIEDFTADAHDMFPKLKRCAVAFVSITRHSCLPVEEQKKFRPVHVVLAEDCIKEVLNDDRSTTIDYCIHALNHLDYESFERMELNKVYGDVMSQIDIRDPNENRARYNDLRRVAKKLAKHLGINLNEEEIEETPSKPEPSRKETAKTKKNAEKEANEQEKEGEEEDEEEMEEPAPSTSKPAPRRGRAPRSAPASATKKKPANDDVLDIFKSPPRNQKKPPSRPATANRPAAAAPSSSRAAHPRSARKLRSDK